MTSMLQASARKCESIIATAARSPCAGSCPVSLATARPAFSLQPWQQRRHRWFSSTDAAKSSASSATDSVPSEKSAADGHAENEATAEEAAPTLEEAEHQMDPFAALKEKHTEELRLMKNQLLTSMADFQNLQKRTERDVRSAREFAVQSFAKDLVNDLDILALALSSVPEGQRSKEGDLKALYDGVSLTAVTLEKTLKRHGVVSFDPMGEVFDPNVHDAVYQAPIPGKIAGTIFDCQKKGWKIGSRLLRPAQVGVVRE